MLNDCKATIAKLKDFDAFESPKTNSKLDLILKKHYPDQPELIHHASVYSAQSQSTQSSLSSTVKKATENAKMAQNVMTKILEDLKHKTFKPMKLPAPGKTVIKLNNQFVQSDPSDSSEGSPLSKLNAKALSSNSYQSKPLEFPQMPLAWKTQFAKFTPASESPSSDISESDIISVLQEVDRSAGYLSEFTHINFEWDKTCLSSHLLTDLSTEERADYLSCSDDDGDYMADLEYMAQRQCRAITSMHSFKSAFGTEPMVVG